MNFEGPNNNNIEAPTSARAKHEEIKKREQNLLKRYTGVAKKIAVALVAITSMTVGADLFAAEKAMASNPDSSASSQPEKNLEVAKKIAFETLKELDGIRYHRFNTEGDEMEARDLIYMFALRLKSFRQAGVDKDRIEGDVFPKDIGEAVKELMKYVDQYIAETRGNKDGKIDVDEMNEFNENLGQKAPGLMQLIVMSQLYQ
jgi:hypothetical protein